MSDAAFTSLSALRARQYDDSKIPEDQQKLIDEEVTRFKDLMEGGLKATYTLRICLLDSGSMVPTPGSLEVFAHKGRRHVDSVMEDKLYFCPGKRLGKSDCDRILPELSNMSSSHTCPYCGNTWDPEEMIGEYKGCLTRQGWATELTRMVERLNREVQIELTIFRKGIREANKQEQLRDLRGEALARARKVLVVRYRFPNLIADLSANQGNLEGRMRAFLNAATEKVDG